MWWDDERDQAQRERGTVVTVGSKKQHVLGTLGRWTGEKGLSSCGRHKAEFYCVHPGMTTSYWTVASIVYYCRLLPLLHVISPDEITRGGVWYPTRNNNYDRMLMQFDPNEKNIWSSFPCKRLDLRIKQEKMLTRSQDALLTKSAKDWLYDWVINCLVWFSLCYNALFMLCFSTPWQSVFSMFMTDWGHHSQTHPEIGSWGQKIWGALKSSLPFSQFLKFIPTIPFLSFACRLTVHAAFRQEHVRWCICVYVTPSCVGKKCCLMLTRRRD